MALFQQRHYEAIAAVLKPMCTTDEAVFTLARYFLQDNPKFKPKLFVKACGTDHLGPPPEPLTCSLRLLFDGKPYGDCIAAVVAALPGG